MSNRKLKVGVVGVGALGRHHTRLYRESSNADLIGVYDANIEAAQKIASEFETKVFASIEELAEACEGLSIAVPATLHHNIAVPLLKMQKHILIEKPLAATVQEAGELVALAEENKVVLEVGHTERYNPAMSFIDSNISDVRFIEARRLAPYPPQRPGSYPRGTEVGVVTDLMIHDLEIILHIVKSNVEKVEAAGIPVLSETEDIANARITFKNGCVANVTASRVYDRSLRRMLIYQSDAYIALDYNDKTGYVCTKEEGTIVKNIVPVIDRNALQDELENFIKNALTAIETGEIPELKVSGKKGLEALRLAVKITEEIHKHNSNYKLNDNMKSSINYF